MLNIKGHDLCGNFCFLLKDPLLQLEAVCMLPLSPGGVKEFQEWSLRQWFCFGSSSLGVELFSTGRKTYLLEPQGIPQVKKREGKCPFSVQPEGNGLWLLPSLARVAPCFSSSCQSVSAAECMACTSKYTVVVAEQIQKAGWDPTQLTFFQCTVSAAGLGLFIVGTNLKLRNIFPLSKCC